MISPRSIRLRVAAVALVASLGLLAVACSDATGGSSTTTSVDGASIAGTGPHDGGTLTVAVSAPPSRWSPTVGEWSASELQAARAVFDTLLARDENDNPVPELLEKIVPSLNSTIWTLTVRSGVTFHDGTPLDAPIVAFDLEAQRLAPSTAALLSPIASIVAADARTVVITMTSPWSTFPQMLTGRIGTIALPATTLGLSPTPIGTGPFTFAATELDGTVALARNPNYWRKGLPHLDGVRLIPIPEAADRVTAVAEGRIGMSAVDEPRQLARLADLPGRDSRYAVHEDRNAEKPKVAVLLDTGRAPFDRIGARRAVTLATDRQQILDEAFAGQATIARGLVSDTSPWFTDHGSPGRDLDRARKEVADYVAETGTPLSFHVLVPLDITMVRAASVWRVQLAAAGIDVVIDLVDDAAIAISTLAGQYQATLDVGFSDAHPDSYEPFFRGLPAEQPAITSNLTRYINPVITKAFADARSTTDAARQIDDYRTVQDQVFVDLPILFLVQLREVVMTTPKLRDVGGWSTGSGDGALSRDVATVSLTKVWLAD